MRLLVVVADRAFRDELHNFLLSAGCTEIALAGSLGEALVQIGRSRPDTVLIDGTSLPSSGVAAVRRLLDLTPAATRIVVFIDPNGRAVWNGEPRASERVIHLFKNRFTRNLLPLLRREWP